MSEYSSYVSDFPARCAEILDKFQFPANRMGREVTLLLSITSAGLIIPHERLKLKGDIPHPSGDRDRYMRAARQYEELLDKPFLSSPLWSDQGVSSWRKGKVRNVRSGGPDSWEELRSAKTVGSEVRACTVLSILRNALAHGNVFTQGRRIQDIVFLSEDRDPVFRFISVSPNDLRKFMMNFFGFLKGLDLSEAPVGGESEVA